MLTRLYIAVGAIAAGVVLAASIIVLAASSRPEQGTGSASGKELDATKQDVGLADPGASGVIVVASQAGLGTYRPDGKLLSSRSPYSAASQGTSADGRWLAIKGCSTAACKLSVGPAGNGQVFRDVPVAASVEEAVWAPSGARLTIRDADGGLSIYNPVTGKLNPIAQSVSQYTWSGDDLIYLTTGAASSTFWSYDGKAARQLTAVAAPVSRFYPSPSGSVLAFLCPAHDGWTLSTLDLVSGAVTSFGNLGAVDEKRSLRQEPPEIAIAWSPDEKQIAVSPVSAPYVLHLLATDGSGQKRYFFDEGYAGELKWSPSNPDVLAISTYSSDRSRHEVYVLDTATSHQPRHLLDGCHIEWAPDGRYMAVKREPSKARGVSAIRVQDGANWPVVAYTGYVPISWGVDEADAMALATRPVNASAVLAK